MGASMVGHLLAAGYSATVYNRSPAKAQALAAKGAVVAASPREVAEASDIVFTIVGFPSDVREVTLGPNGVLAGLRRGGIVVDMTTSEPSLAVEIAACVGGAEGAGSGRAGGERAGCMDAAAHKHERSPLPPTTLAIPSVQRGRGAGLRVAGRARVGRRHWRARGAAVYHGGR
jgi:hypothetical protein